VGSARQPEPVRLIVGLLAADRDLLDQAALRLSQAFGPIDERSEPVPFDHTTYYARELGEHAWRQFLTFAELVDPGELARIKTQTNQMEQEFAAQGGRLVNLDPGYISLTKLVLASTKNHWHRIYLRQGIYAEVTLPYRNGAFRPQEWTYPDYRVPEHLRFFTAARERYRRQLRAAGITSRPG
jgi:hypothetical protein